jgi:hypothetical protein
LRIPLALAILRATLSTMLRTHTQRLPARLRGKVPGRLPALLAGAALLLAPVTPAQAVRTVAPPPPPPPAAPASDMPSAGDENIPLEPAEPGQITPGDKPRSSGSPNRTRGSLPPIKGSVEQGFALGDQADAAFDAGNYGEAARLYTRALEQLSENESNHVMRSVLVANGVTSYEQLYATSHDVEYLRRAQRVLQDYLRACKTKYGTGCERYPETQESRARLQQINASIEVAVPARAKIPPEIGAAPGGKPYDLTVQLPPTPAWIAPAMAGGILLAGGGAALVYYSATAEKYGPIYDREGEFGETADTTTGTDTTGTDTADTAADTATGGSSPGLSATELTPDAKGKILIGFGAFLAAAGIGLVVLSSMRLAKHKRLNRQRARTLAVTPTFSRDGGGLALTGRF